jgi:hypothetical protein
MYRLPSYSSAITFPVSNFIKKLGIIQYNQSLMKNSAILKVTGLMRHLRVPGNSNYRAYIGLCVINSLHEMLSLYDLELVQGCECHEGELTTKEATDS